MQPKPDRNDGNDHGGLDRRSFLQTGALLGAGALAGPLRAAAAAPPLARRPVTVVLFQRGGADQLCLFAPTGDSNYAALRPTTAVAAPGGPGSVVGLYMDPTFSMHPSLLGLHAAYTAPQSRVAVVHATGHVPYDRSHFTSQDLMETGTADGSRTDGWINRHLQATATANDAPVRALALLGSRPRSLAGAYPCYAVASTADLAFKARLPDMRQTLQLIVENTPIAAMSAPHQLAYRSSINAFDLIDHFAGLSPSTYVPAGGAVYPNSSLGRSLRQAAELIKADLGVEFIAVDQGGWDHHSSLLTRVATYATDLDAAVSAFLTDLGPRANVVLVTMSEFGREVRENGSFGTDHGVGGAMLLAGGSVRGGQVHGVWPGLAPSALRDGRFLAPANDFRDVLTELLEHHMGGTDANVVFPGHAFTPIGVV